MNKLLLMIFLIFIAVNIYAKVDYEVLWEKDLDLPDYIKNIKPENKKVFLCQFKNCFLIGYLNMIYLIDSKGKEYFRKELKPIGITPGLSLIGDTEIYVYVHNRIDYKTGESKITTIDIKGDILFERTFFSPNNKYWDASVTFYKELLLFNYIEQKLFNHTEENYQIIEFRDVRWNLKRKIIIKIDDMNDWAMPMDDIIQAHSCHLLGEKLVYTNHYSNNWGIMMMDLNGNEIYRNFRRGILPILNENIWTNGRDRIITIGEYDSSDHEGKYFGIIKNDTFIYENDNFGFSDFPLIISNNGRYIFFRDKVFDIEKKEKYLFKFGELFSIGINPVEINDSGYLFISNFARNKTYLTNYSYNYALNQSSKNMFSDKYCANYNIPDSHKKYVLYIFTKNAEFIDNIVLDKPFYEWKCIDVDKILLTLDNKIQVIKVKL